ncbi:hypothetical protein [Propionivibrio sp.]|uniref:hypothetical protein n=1 Tax=Propionivibrio sp. TaxID=2212460 RepID=UPI003BF233F3
MPHKPGIGAIFGIVAEDGVAKVDSPVRLYDRTTGQLVRAVTTNVDGGYVFSGLDETTSDYMVLAVDNDGANKKNALVYDYITPMPAAQGESFDGNWQVVVGKYAPIMWACGKRALADK